MFDESILVQETEFTSLRAGVYFTDEGLPLSTAELELGPSLSGAVLDPVGC